MLAKLQLDFPILGCAEMSSTLPPLHKVELPNNNKQRNRNKRMVHQGFGSQVHTPTTHDRFTSNGLVHEFDSNTRGSGINTRGHDVCVTSRDSDVEMRSGSGSGNNGVAKKLPTRCSTKCRTSYGGCIPAILKALDQVEEGLDEALKPWQDTLTNKERSIILKEQFSWERALEIFEWFKRKGCYEMHIIHYNIVFRILGKAGKWSHVQRLWIEMNDKGIAPINSTYGTLIDLYSKGGFSKEALLWLQRMTKQGMKPDEVTMGTVLQLYKKAGQFQKAEEFFKKWSESSLHSHNSLSCQTYNTLIDTHGKAGQLKQASAVFGLMLREGIAPSTVTFNTLIHIFGNHGQLTEVAAFVYKMEERYPPNTRTYNILISLYANHNNIEMAAMYYKKMKEAYLEPDLVSYRTLLYAYSVRRMVSQAEDLIMEMDERVLEIDEFTHSALTRMYIEAGMLKKSWVWFMRFHLSGKMGPEWYSANIDAYGERGHILEAEKVFCCCREVKKLSVLEFNVMIKAYAVGKYYDSACQLFDSMKIHGVIPDRCSYSSLIHTLASGYMPQTAMPYLKKMQESGLVSDCIPYCAVISSFTKLGQLEMAEELFKQMVRFNVQPDIIVFGVLINAFADVGSVEKALSYVDAMKIAGFSGNTVIYNTLIKLYTKVGLLKEAEETYKLLLSSEDAPAIYASNCMIDLYSERSMVEQAEELFDSLKRKGEANEFTFSMMLCMYKRMRRFEEAIQIAKQMRELGLLTDLLSYNNVIGLYAMYGRFKEVVGTVKEMIKAAVQPDECTFKSLGNVLLNSGVSKQAVEKLEVLVKKDARGDLQAWISVLSSVVMNESDYT